MKNLTSSFCIKSHRNLLFKTLAEVPGFQQGKDRLRLSLQKQNKIGNFQGFLGHTSFNRLPESWPIQLKQRGGVKSKGVGGQGSRLTSGDYVQMFLRWRLLQVQVLGRIKDPPLIATLSGYSILRHCCLGQVLTVLQHLMRCWRWTLMKIGGKMSKWFWTDKKMAIISKSGVKPFNSRYLFGLWSAFLLIFCCKD